jgi:GlpG protein
MRLIGHLKNERAARLFGDFLHAQHIPNQVDAEGDSWSVWVHADEDMEPARQWLERFEHDPESPEFIGKAREGARMRRDEEAEQKAYAGKVKDRAQIFARRNTFLPPLTISIMILSVLVFALTRLGEKPEQALGLFISTTYELTNVREGQVWRLVTPVFIHFTVWHLVMNLFWILDLGAAMERALGTLRMFLLFVGLAVFSNLFQFYVNLPPVFVRGPAFGGLSGVVFGLIGYTWIRGRLDPGYGLALSSSTVILSIIWFFWCIVSSHSGFVGAYANGAHAGGLLMGMLLGWIAARWNR